MLYFPQLPTGSVSHFPLSRRTSFRTVGAPSEDGHRVTSADIGGRKVQWSLSFSQLSDDEINQLVSFFNETEGRLQSFTFLDPAANLLSWSEDLNQPVWQKSSLLHIAGDIRDPYGSSRAVRVINSSGTQLALEQTLNIPGTIVCCFSVYARSDTTSSLTISRASGGSSLTSTFSVTREWTRLTLSGVMENSAESSAFRLDIDGGSTVDLFGFQVDAQPGASKYSPSFADGGVYSMARFDSDVLAVTASGPNRNACTLQVISTLNG